MTLLVRVAQKQANIVSLDSQIALVGEQVVECLGILLGELSRLDLLIRVIVDADQHHVGLWLAGRSLFLSCSSRGRGQRERQNPYYDQEQNSPHSFVHRLEHGIGSFRLARGHDMGNPLLSSADGIGVKMGGNNSRRPIPILSGDGSIHSPEYPRKRPQTRHSLFCRRFTTSQPNYTSPTCNKKMKEISPSCANCAVDPRADPRFGSKTEQITCRFQAPPGKMGTQDKTIV